MSPNFALSRTRPATGLILCLLVCFSACQRPVAPFQRGSREVFHTPAPALSESEPDNVPELPEHASLPTVYARLSVEPTENSAGKPVGSARPMAERIGQHQIGRAHV